jgi:hypothetical protein
MYHECSIKEFCYKRIQSGTLLINPFCVTVNIFDESIRVSMKSTHTIDTFVSQSINMTLSPVWNVRQGRQAKHPKRHSQLTVSVQCTTLSVNMENVNLWGWYVQDFDPVARMTGITHHDILFRRMLWLFSGMGSSDAITCGMVIPPETIISAAINKNTTLELQ